MRIAEYKQVDERIEEYTVIVPAECDEQGNLIAKEHEEVRTRTVPIMGMSYRDMTPEEEAELFTEPYEVSENSNPLKEMAQAMSTATSLAQMRAAAKAFLTATEAESD